MFPETEEVYKFLYNSSIIYLLSYIFIYLSEILMTTIIFQIILAMFITLNIIILGKIYDNSI